MTLTDAQSDFDQWTTRSCSQWLGNMCIALFAGILVATVFARGVPFYNVQTEEIGMNMTFDTTTESSTLEQQEVIPEDRDHLQAFQPTHNENTFDWLEFGKVALGWVELARKAFSM